MGIEYLLFSMVLAIPSALAALWVKSTFTRFSKVGVRSGMTGAQAAEAVLRAGGVGGVRVEAVRGFLSDHYDPRAKALRLSPDVYGGRSISAIAVAAHEAGHAIQDARSYGPLVLRSAVVPLANIGNRLWMLPFFIGLVTGILGIAWIGVGLFALTLLFQLVTLPTEFDASRRAKLVLAETGIVSTQEEASGVASVLRAAAMTYVAAAVTSLAHLLYLVMQLQGRSND